jgi:CheY-like chemotaxis protein
MAINRERLLAISDLKLAGKIEEMDENKLASYVQLLNSFSTSLPDYEKRINDALASKNNDALIITLTLVWDTLKKIYADELAQDCGDHLCWIGNKKHEKVEAYARYLLAILGILSSDIKKAQQEHGDLSDYEKPSTNAAMDGNIAKINDDPSRKTYIERLLEISDLKLAGKIELMGDEELNNYLQLLDSFIETLPAQEEKITASLKMKNNDLFAKLLMDLRFVLERMYAEELVQDCTKQINAVGTTSTEKTEAYMRYFLSNLSMLSIDIQMAGQKMDLPAALPDRNTDEEYSNGIKILAVDDTAFFLTILKKILSDRRYLLTCVASGRDALKYLEKHEPDIFLLDIEMPGMDGYELAERIKGTGQKAPIIFLTGNAKKEYLSKAVNVGAVDFIIKPINKDVLISKIHKYLR